MEALIIATTIAYNARAVAVAVEIANVPSELEWYYGFSPESFERQCGSGLRAWLEYGK